MHKLVKHFHLEHTIPAPRSAVEAALLRPAILQAVADHSPIRYRVSLLSQREVDDLVDRQSRVDARELRRAGGSARLPDRALWTERLIWRRRDHAATFIIQPLLTAWPQQRFACHGEYWLEAVNARSTRRVVQGEVSVEVPAAGPELEAGIDRLLEAHFAAEARVLGALSRSPSGSVPTLRGGELP